MEMLLERLRDPIENSQEQNKHGGDLFIEN